MSELNSVVDGICRVAMLAAAAVFPRTAAPVAADRVESRKYSVLKAIGMLAIAAVPIQAGVAQAEYRVVPIGATIHVYDTGTFLIEPRAVQLTDGNIVFAWQDNSNGQDFARILDSAWKPIAEPFQLNSGLGGSAIELVARPGGAFSAIWDVTKGVGQSELRGRHYGAGGVPRGLDFLISDTLSRQNQGENLVATPFGTGFLATWSAQFAGGSQDETRSRVVRANKTLGPEIRYYEGTGTSEANPAAALLGDGRTIVAWSSDKRDGEGGDLHAQFLSSAGQKVGGTFVTGAKPGAGTGGAEGVVSAAALPRVLNSAGTAIPDGGYVLAWDVGTPASYSDIRAAVFKADGSRITDVAVSVDPSAPTVVDSHPAVVGLTGGGFVVSWTRNPGTGAAQHLARAYNARNVAVGEEFPVLGTALTAIGGQSFLVTFDTAEGLRAQRYAVRRCTKPQPSCT